MENENFIIYKLTNTVNNKIYVGGTTDTIDTRFHRHVVRSLKGSEYPLHKAIREYGEEAFEKVIIEDCSSLEQMNERERYWIAALSATNPEIGYNTDKGGHVISEKCREARRQQLLGSKLTGSQLEIVRENGMKIAKAVYQYDPKTGELIGEYPSIIGASRSTGCDRRTIQRQLSGESNTGSAHSLGNLKYIWRYKE